MQRGYTLLHIHEEKGGRKLRIIVVCLGFSPQLINGQKFDSAVLSPKDNAGLTAQILFVNQPD